MKRDVGESGNQYQGRDPYEILEEAIALRPVPAIEKPLGRRGEVAPSIVPIDLNSLGGLNDWNGTMRGRERG